MAFFWWRLERFAEVCQDLPDPPWLADRKSAATRRDAGPDRGRTRSGPFLRPHSAVLDRRDEFQNVLDRRVGQDAVAEIEDVAGAAARLGEDLPRLPTDRVSVR